MKNFAVEVGPEQPNGGRIRRSKNKFGDKRAFGFRKVEQIIEEEKEIVKIVKGEEQKTTKTWKYFQLSGYHYLSYNAASKLAHEIGCGFVHLGLTNKAKVEIFAPTNAHWLVTAHAVFTQASTIVTAYDTLGEEGLLHSMNETEVEAIFTTGELLTTVAKVIEQCPTCKIVVYNGETTVEAIAAVKKGSVQHVVSFDELARIGKEHPYGPRRPEPEDIACIMYTSGSTGNPKGVTISHKNIVAALAGANKLLGHLVNEKDSMMAYLPLAHILEFVVENVCIFWGVTLGYASVRTLTDMSVRNCKGDIREFRPTIMTGVPQVWESIRKGVLGKVNGLSPKAQAMFHKAFATKQWLMERHLPTGFLDKTIFGKIRDQVGGRLRFALSGGAPVSIETQRFLSITLCPILGGYGMTESCGMSGVCAPEQFAYGIVGAPMPCCEIKLVDVPDAGYFSTNEKPQGEVWVRGPSITSGYWKREDLTKETITEDGWLETGDIAEWNENGTLTIIDRKKNLVKLSNGEYIALEKLESIYKSCIYVNNICVCADSLRARPVALVVPVEASVRKLATDEDAEWADICADSEVKDKILKAILAQGKQASLKPAELLFDIHLCPDEWTIESGLVTAAQKIKRQDITRLFKDALDAMNAAQGS
ncbi:hypothetical protein BJV82DRAFT_625176 [Fennellomyces sp. T-0311]|nr:hypothetical protein BJV82DRAFT_625176 [Fennellomyces sp. T-0311]